jgi:DNA-binding CsgD family transcriptional regulator
MFCEASMPSTDKLLRLVGLAYDAAEQPALWHSFLRETASVLHCNLATFVLHDLTSLDGAIAVTEGSSAEAERLYEQVWGAKNIYMERGACCLEPGTVVHGGMLCTDDEILKSEYYNEFLRPNDWFYVAGGPVVADGKIASMFSLQRPRRKGQFADREISTLRFLMPHLQRAIRLHQHLHTLRHGLQALNALTIGVVTVSASGKMLFANKCAERILAHEDGIGLTRKGIVAASGAMAQRLKDLIALVAETTNGVSIHAGGLLAIERRSGRRPYFVLVSPMRFSLLTCTAEKPAAILFINDSEQRVRHAPAVLRDLFGMTPAECRVALLIGDGRSRSEIADLLNVSSNTLKSQMASIYRKTGISQQAQLVHLLARLPVSDAADA